MELTNKLTHPLFKNFSADELGYLLQTAKISAFKIGEILIHEGEIGQEIYVLLDGKVDVSKKGEPPEEITPLAVLEAGNILGEISVITNNPRSATVTAIENTTVLIIDIATIKHEPTAQPIYEKLLQNLAIELSKKLLYFGNKLIKCNAGEQHQKELAEDQAVTSPPNSILVLFGWKWSDIMHEAPFLSEHGYDAIKISPPPRIYLKDRQPLVDYLPTCKLQVKRALWQ